MAIDHARAAKEYRAQKAAWTRAVNSKNPDEVKAAGVTAVRQWNAPGSAWPDDWARWQRALDDVLPRSQSATLDQLEAQP